VESPSSANAGNSTDKGHRDTWSELISSTEDANEENKERDFNSDGACPPFKFKVSPIMYSPFVICWASALRRGSEISPTRGSFLEKDSAYPALAGLVGGTLNVRLIATHWNEILHLASSIKQGTVTASLILRKLGAYPRQNSLALALRELGRLERTLFTLQRLQSPELRQRVQLGLNKGEAKNALARAVFFNRLGELRDRSFENQRYRASGLNLVVTAIVLWNTVYLERAVHGLREQGQSVDEYLLAHLSPLGWEHINLTGDYVWHSNKRVAKGRFRPLRSPKDSMARLFTPQTEA
jgi:hypothetical protein